MYNSGIGTPYWFEWEIGILECLNMLQDTSIESVILQSTDFQALDDVVVNYSDKSILNIQVKHTDEDANFTYSFLASGKKPLLNELALEWKNNKDNYNFKGIQIVTNKKWGPQETDGKCSMDDFISKVFPCLQDNYNYTSAKPNEQKAIEWYRENLEINLDSNEAACFTKIFSFRKESCLADVEEKIRVKIGEILGTDNSDAIDFCLNSLLSKLNIWATSRREKQEITRENVYGALCYTEPDVPSYELCPEKPILPSRQRFGETFIDDIKKNSNHIIFLEGLPGCGKTNFISYLSQMNESIVDFRFYTYLPVNKVDGSYSDDEGFYLGNILWRSILVQLKKKFEENNLLSVVKFPLIYQFMSVSEMRETVIHFLPEYAKCIGRPCYFFIDGLDHAARSKDARNSFLSQLPRPEEIGDDFYFVLVGQPINDGYPSWMKDNKGITYYSMPALDSNIISSNSEQDIIVEELMRLDNKLKDYLLHSQKKFPKGQQYFNILVIALEIASDLDEWYSYILGENGVFTDRTFIDDDYSNVDAILLCTPVYGIKGWENFGKTNVWKLEETVNILLLDPRKEQESKGYFYFEKGIDIFGTLSRAFLSYQNELDKTNAHLYSNEEGNTGFEYIQFKELDLRICSAFLQSLEH